ncbi:MAG: hypothetical protein JNK63_06180 [Chthonomonas sp.]|nr:hypothetical protein [Chthonomonas sp.]
MKLNLVPATAKKGAAMKTMVVLSIATVLLSGLATAFMAYQSSAMLAQAKEDAEAARPNAVAAVAYAKRANEVLEKSRGVTTNLTLAQEMSAHNSKYTRFYTKVLPYVPAFFRVTSISIDPIDANSCRLNMTGVLQTAQQYADLSLALLRIPGAQAISRAGFVTQWDDVPALTAEDQRGLMVRQGQIALPEDPVARMEAVSAWGTEQTTGFANVGNFGSATESARGAMTRWSNIGVSVLLAAPGAAPAQAPGQPAAPAAAGGPLPPGWSFDFLTPNPTDTLNGAAQFNVPGAAPAGGAAPAPAATPEPRSQDGLEGR